jgi:hypothetical protein
MEESGGNANNPENNAEGALGPLFEESEAMDVDAAPAVAQETVREEVPKPGELDLVLELLRWSVTDSKKKMEAIKGEYFSKFLQVT